MINRGDPQAVAIYQRYEKQKMPDTKLTNNQIQAIIDYIKSFNKSVTKKKSDVNLPANGNQVQGLKELSKIVEDIASKENEQENRLEDIEKKIDMLLEFQKKSLKARITTEEIEKGEVLFEGKIPFTENVPACVSCHNTAIIDTLNWNPSALDIAETFSHRNDEDMVKLIISPESNKMKDVLKEHKLTDDESFYITAYLQNIEKTGLKENKKLPVKLLVFVSLCIVMLVALFDLIFTKIIKQKMVNITAILVAGILVYNTLYASAKNIGLSQNYAPAQPIKFSHKIHVKENKISCLFCHNSPEFSRESGIPTTNVCMLCHNKIKTGVMTGQFEINKIRKSFEKKKPIEWIKVHNLPDHVFFSHAEHVSNAKIECQTCHGDVQEMNVTQQFASLSMGWCVQCHRETKVQFEENNYYSGHRKLHKDLKTGKIAEVTADKIGANDCQKCHY